MAHLARRIGRIHKLLGLVIGLQLLFWTASGLFFTLYPIEVIRGDPWRPAVDHGDLDLDTVEIEAARLPDLVNQPVTMAELRPFLGQPVWHVETKKASVMIDAITGERLSPLNQGNIDRLIEAFGAAPIGLGELTVTYMISENPLREYTGPLPAWVLEYEPGKQRIYIDAMSGDIVSVRTTRWRIFDVLWRLHIMDVTSEDRFDSWWLKLAAFLGLTTVLFGFALLIDRARKGRLFR